MANFFMNYANLSAYGGMNMGLFSAVFTPIVLALLVWTLYWKYRALWYAAKHDDKWWFIALMIINTLGILEIVYLYVINKQSGEPSGHDENSVPMVQ